MAETIVTTTPDAWEQLIAARLFPETERPLCTVDSVATRSEDDRSFELYRRLITLFREGTIAEMLENTTRLLLLELGKEQLRALLQRYFAASLPPAYPTDEALGFRTFMDRNPAPVKGLAEVLQFEATLAEAAANSTTVSIALPRNIGEMVAELAAGRVPCSASALATFEIGVDPAPFVRLADAETL